MTKNKTTGSLVGIIITSLLYGLAVGVQTFKRLQFPMSYNDFTDGMALTGLGKSHEVATIFTFMVISIVTSYGLSKYRNWIVNNYTEKEINDFDSFLIYINLPFLVWVGMQVFNNDIVTFDILNYNFLISLLSVFLTFFWLKYSRNSSKLEQPFIVIPVLIVLTLTVPYFFSNILLRYDIEFNLTHLVFLFSFFWAILFVALINNKYYSIYSLLLLQLFAIGSIVKLIPFHYRIDDLKQHVPISIFLYSFVFLLISVGILDVFKRFFRNREISYLKSSSLSPFAFVGILILIGLKFTIPGISPDDYHFGEKLLPLFLIQNYQSIPYIDYSFAHGFYDMFGSLGSALFFDGNASTFDIGSAVIRMGIITVFFIISSKILCDNFKAFFLSFLVLFLGEIYIIGVLMSLVLTYRISEKWLGIVYLIMGLLIYLISPSIGSIFILGLLPLVTMRIVKAKLVKENLKGIAYFCLVFIAICILIPTFYQMIFGSLRYIIENSVINYEAWGIPWEFSWDSSKTPNSSILIFELIRFSWALVPLIITIFFIKNKIEDRRIIFYGLFILVFIVLIHKYSMGRIDTFRLSRPGQISQAVLPLIFILFATTKRMGMYIVIFLCVIFGTLNPNYIDIFSSNKIETIGSARIVDGSEIGLASIGLGHHDPKHIKGIISIKKTIDKFLEEKETFLNLSNRGALHYYLNREKVIEAVPLNLANLKMQKRVIAKMDMNPPPIFFIEKNSNFPIRTEQLYKWALQNYYPIEIEDHFYGIHKKYVVRFKERFPKLIIETDSQKLIKTWDILFDRVNLAGIPVAWGLSKSSLDDKMAIVKKLPWNIVRMNDMIKLKENQFQLRGKDPFFVIDISDLNISGNNSGLLVFDFNREEIDLSTRLEVFFETENFSFNQNTHVTFDGHNGTLIVNLDAKPAWQLAKKVKKIRIDVENPKDLKSIITVSNITLMKRI